MTWSVLLHDDFGAEFVAFDERWQDELLAHAKATGGVRAEPGSSHVATLKGLKARGTRT